MAAPSDDAPAAPERPSVDQTRLLLFRLRDSLFASDPQFKAKPLSQLNAEALSFHRAGDDLRCVASYAKLFRKLRENRVTHPGLYSVHVNRSLSYLNLGLFEEALWDARRAAQLAEAAFSRTQAREALQCYAKSFARKGFALLGLSLARAAKAAFEQGLAVEPADAELKRGLELASQQLLKELLSGGSREALALPPPVRVDRITALPASSPLHVVHGGAALPSALLTPFQAESDHHVRDTYNYLTVQADIRLPKRQLAALADTVRTAAFERAIQHAVAALAEQDKDARALHIGAGGGLLPLQALRAGARHVTVAERWLYLALAAKECLAANGVPAEKAAVVYKRPSDLLLRTDVPVACNLLVVDMLEDGLLSAGLIPAFRSAMEKLCLPDVIAIPASATVFAQAVELRSGTLCGLDVSPANLHRWQPGHSAGRAAPGAVAALSPPVSVWHFDMVSPPSEAQSKLVDLCFEAGGRFNAVRFWFELQLGGGVTLSSGPDGGCTSLHPAVQYLPGELAVEAGAVIPLRCAHNTVALRFDLEREEYVHLYRAEPTFPPAHFQMLRDVPRAQAFDAAIRRQVAKLHRAGADVHAIDLGCGTGVLAMLAARAGCASVVACDISEPLALAARRCVAANGLSRTVSVLCRDAGLLERGREVRRGGANMVLFDLFDCGLLGDKVMPLLGALRRHALQPGAVCVPAAATLYVMGLEVHKTAVGGFDLSPLDKYRWEPGYEQARLHELPHTQLTAPRRVFETFFDGSASTGPGTSSAQDGLLKLDVLRSGTLNAVVFWFDLHLDEDATITSAPAGFGPGGEAEPARVSEAGELVEFDATCGVRRARERVDSERYWGQAVQYLESSISVEAGAKQALLFRVEAEKLSFSLKPAEGAYVAKPPWRITWGGGASVESPHFQRVHYCELLVKDFLMRVTCRRFPPIEKDLRMVLAHCGSLFLDPASLAEAFRELVGLEALHLLTDVSAWASAEAVYKRVQLVA